MFGQILPCTWNDAGIEAFSSGWVPVGKILFTAEQTEAILMWLKNEGYAGLTLESYLDHVIGPLK